MFCYQCEQTAHGTGCATVGTCGKSPEVADLQDLVMHVALELAACAGKDAADYLEFAIFSTLTNVNFDADRMESLIREGARKIVAAGGQSPVAADASREQMLQAATVRSISTRRQKLGDDVTGLQELLAYGLKGTVAYAHHARVIGYTSPEVDALVSEALTFLTRPTPTIDELLVMNLRCGEAALKAIELLDRANTSRFGHPVPTPVSLGHRKGRAILVSGHDLGDLQKLLEMTAGKGIDVYTHGEMLPAHGYPELNRHPHLAGHYGDAWQHQLKDFEEFPGAILMTTNCLIPPRESYRGRLFTTGPVGHANLRHLASGDFAPVIDAALAAPGFADDVETSRHTVGFGHNAVLGVANVVVDAVKSGALKRFVLIGGCNGSVGDFDYYKRLSASLPQDWAVLTLGCGKFQVLGQVTGNIGPLPRLLDMGQCNDAFSAIKVASALADAFGCGVNDLPLSLVLSWFEQKAVAVLLALLHLGVRNIRVGPRVAAFMTPAIMKVLSEKFNLMAIGDVEADLKAMTKAA
jgi:hydroxylamine reductase